MTRHPLLHILLLHAAALLLAAACGEARLPRQLVEADSAMMHGRYRAADSLIAACASSDEALAGEPARMYLRLLRLGMKEKHMQPMEDDLLPADTLRRYYERHGPRRLYALSLFYSGCAWRDLRDHPSALDCFLRAAAEARQAGDLRLLSWIYKQKGNLYFDQMMYEDCISDYRNFYHYAKSCQDTLQLAYASFCMGRVYTIMNKVDSALYSYSASVAFGNKVVQAPLIIPFAKERLADIYIQIEELDSAAILMTRDSVFFVDWAYWHLARNNLDSALYYFGSCQEKELTLYGQAENLRMMAGIERRKGNYSNAVEYYETYLTRNDSARKLARESDIRKTNAQYNYRLINEQRYIHQQRADKLQAGLLILIVILILSSIALYYLWKSHKSRQETMILSERWLREMERNKSRRQMEENQRKIARLETLLEEANMKEDEAAVSQLMLSSSVLKAENEKIKANVRLRQYSVKKIKSTPFFCNIIDHLDEESFILKEDDKKNVIAIVNANLEDFIFKLEQVATMNEDELCMCCLTAVGFRQKVIARLLCKTENAVSMERLRLIRQITRNPKSRAKDFVHFIEEI